MIDQITQNLFVNVCRGLFEAHKIIFAFMLSTAIKRNKCELDELSINILLRGCGIYDKSKQPSYKKHEAIHDFMSEQ